MITWENVKTGKILSFAGEKQFYNSVNSKLINELNAVADELKKDEENANKNRRNKVMSEHQVIEILNPISRNKITRECEIAETDDIISNSIEDYQMEMERDLQDEEEQNRYMEKCEDEFFKWGEEPEIIKENLPE